MIGLLGDVTLVPGDDKCGVDIDDEVLISINEEFIVLSVEKPKSTA